MPDLTILINDEPEKIICRAKSRGKLSKYENLATQKSVQSLYQKLAKRFISRFRVISAENRELEDIFLEAFSLCKGILG
jgi:thymidylate kinase